MKESFVRPLDESMGRMNGPPHGESKWPPLEDAEAYTGAVIHAERAGDTLKERVVGQSQDQTPQPTSVPEAEENRQITIS